MIHLSSADCRTRRARCAAAPIGTGAGIALPPLVFWTMTIDIERDRLEVVLAGLGQAFELFPCDPAFADTARFCAAYGFELGDSANTIVVVGKAEPRRYAACIVLATHRLDVNRTVRDRLGTRKASFASADETRALTGMEIGGGAPLWAPPAPPPAGEAAGVGGPPSRPC